MQNVAPLRICRREKRAETGAPPPRKPEWPAACHHVRSKLPFLTWKASCDWPQTEFVAIHKTTVRPR